MPAPADLPTPPTPAEFAALVARVMVLEAQVAALIAEAATLKRRREKKNQA